MSNDLDGKILNEYEKALALRSGGETDKDAINRELRSSTVEILLRDQYSHLHLHERLDSNDFLENPEDYLVVAVESAISKICAEVHRINLKAKPAALTSVIEDMVNRTKLAAAGVLDRIRPPVKIEHSKASCELRDTIWGTIVRSFAT